MFQLVTIRYLNQLHIVFTQLTIKRNIQIYTYCICTVVHSAVNLNVAQCKIQLDITTKDSYWLMENKLTINLEKRSLYDIP